MGISFVTLYFDTKSKDPFNTPKLIALILIATFYFGIVATNIVSLFRTGNFSLNVTLYLALIFWLSMLISSIYTDDKLIALIGDTQRRNGFFAYTALIIIFLTATILINFTTAKVLIKSVILTGFIFSMYGIIQSFGFDPIKWVNPYNSVISTVGNPNFASALMAVFSVILLFTLNQNNYSIFFKFFASLTLVLSVLAIIKSDSRQGLVSLGIGILFYLSVFYYLNYRKLGVYFAVGSGLVLIFAILGMLQKGPLASLIYKTSVSIRGYYWSAGFEMFESSPFLGIGIDSYGQYFKEFRRQDYPLRFGYELGSSNAHNTFIQFFATGGIFLGLSYFLLILFILLMGLKLVSSTSKEQHKISLTILSSWVAFQAQSVISIDNIGISVWGWVLGGSIVGLYKINYFESIKLSKDKNFIKSTKFSKEKSRIISIIVLLPVLFVCVLLNRAEKNTFLAAGFAANANTPQNREVAYSYAKKVLENPLADQNYKLAATYALIDAGFRDESYLYLNKLLNQYPRNEYLYLELSTIEEKNGNLDLAIVFREQLSILDPWNAKNYLKLVQLYKADGRYSKAVEINNKIQSFAANTEISKLSEFEIINGK
jgi:O-antigen ligase